MFSSSVILFAVANFASVFAQTAHFDVLTSPPQGATYAVNDTLPIAWEVGTFTGTVSIELTGGASPSLLGPVVQIVAGLDSTLGAYNWTIASNIGTFAAYGLNLTADDAPDFQYSNGFFITGGTAVTGVSSVSSVASTSGSASTPGTTSAPASVSTSIVTTTVTSSSVSSSGIYTNSTATKTTAKNSTTTASSTTSASATTTKSAGAVKFVSGSLAGLAVFVFALVL